MESIIKDYLNNNVSLLTLLNYINNCDLTEKQIFDIINNHPEDERTYICYIILFYIKKYHFDNFDHPFIGFLKSIIIETENDFSASIEWFLQNEEALSFKIDHIYFFINNYNKKYNFNLPEEIQNSYQICLNCNDEIYFKSVLILHPVEFYIVGLNKDK